MKVNLSNNNMFHVSQQMYLIQVIYQAIALLSFSEITTYQPVDFQFKRECVSSRHRYEQ